MGFKMIYWTPISGSYFLKGCILEFFLEKQPFFRGIWPDWGKTARADMAGLWSIGLTAVSIHMGEQMQSGKQ